MPSPDSTALRPSLDGEVLLPVEPGFDAARRTFNALIERPPSLVVRPTSTAGVAAAVRHAVADPAASRRHAGGPSVSVRAVPPVSGTRSGSRLVARNMGTMKQTSP